MKGEFGTVELRSGDRVFERIYIEQTTWRWKDDPTGPVVHVNLVTEAWFENGVLLLEVRCTKGGERPYFEGDHDPTGLTLQKNCRRSAAVRLSIKAHDLALEQVRQSVPQNAERLS
jgi:hypothetical protein